MFLLQGIEVEFNLSSKRGIKPFVPLFRADSSEPGAPNGGRGGRIGLSGLVPDTWYSRLGPGIAPSATGAPGPAGTAANPIGLGNLVELLDLEPLDSLLEDSVLFRPSALLVEFVLAFEVEFDFVHSQIIDSVVR